MILGLLLGISALFAADVIDPEMITGIVSGGGTFGGLLVAYFLFDKLGLIKKRGAAVPEEERTEAETLPPQAVKNTAFYNKKFTDEQREEKLDDFLRRVDDIDFQQLADRVDDLWNERSDEE